MERLSLDQKIAYCQKFGTLKTLTENEALSHFTDYYDEGKIDGIIATYEAGKYCCSFIVDPKHDERFDTVYQINTLGGFVRDIVYFMLTD